MTSRRAPATARGAHDESQKLRPTTDFQIASEQFEMACEVMNLDEESRVLPRTPFRERLGIDASESTAAIQGFGQVGSHAARIFEEQDIDMRSAAYDIAIDRVARAERLRGSE